MSVCLMGNPERDEAVVNKCELATNDDATHLYNYDTSPQIHRVAVAPLPRLRYLTRTAEIWDNLVHIFPHEYSPLLDR